MNATNGSVHSCPGQGAGASFCCAGEAKLPVPEPSKKYATAYFFDALNHCPEFISGLFQGLDYYQNVLVNIFIIKVESNPGRSLCPRGTGTSSGGLPVPKNSRGFIHY